MDKNIELYFKGQDNNSKLIYTVGILWGKISSNLDEILNKYGLNISKFNILMIIKHLGGKEGIQQNEISKKLLVTPSNITKLLDKLEKEKMITRNPKSDDRRVKLIKINSETSKLLDTVWPLYIKQVEKLTAGINKADLNNLEKKLVEWLTNIK